MARAVSFNGQDLQSSSFATSDLPHENSQLSVDISQVGAYGGRKTNVRVGTKDLVISGWAKAADASALDTLIDTLKTNMVGKEGNLDVDYAGATRRYTAVCTGFEVNRGRQNISMCPVALKFTILSLGKLTSPTTQNNAGKTADYAGSITCLGSAAPRPTLTLTVNTQTALSVVRISNDTTVQYLQINRTFVNGDVIIVDCDAQTVKINGTLVDYVGVIPQFTQGVNAFTVDITATAVNYDFLLSYYPLYY